MVTKKVLFQSSALISLTGFSCLSIMNSCNQPEAKQKPNVLFIAVDDLRPELNCYGKHQIHSPNIDRIANEGFQFNRAYCNIPVCGASRASILTGTRPTRNRFITYHTWIDKDNPDVTTLPEHFRKNGYYTITNSKVMHHEGDAQGSWDEEWWPPTVGSWRNYVLPENIYIDTTENRGPSFERAELPDTAYKDGVTARKTIEDLKRIKDMDQPFFLAVGFLKPHLPFNAPDKYWKLYNRDSIKLPDNPFPPENAPKQAIHNWGELRSYYGIPPEGPLTDEMAKTLIHGYYACVSYTDAQIGKVLDALDELGLSENTVVVLWGDHGWNLREHGLWCKHCNFRTSLRAPLLLKVPGMEGKKEIDRIVEFVDIYPTIAELCGLELPQHLEGESLVKILKDPESEWKDFAISKYHDGISIKTDQFLYTEWSSSDSAIVARMMYDHQKDIDENLNISEMEDNQEILHSLQEKLHENWGKDFNQ